MDRCIRFPSISTIAFLASMIAALTSCTGDTDSNRDTLADSLASMAAPPTDSGSQPDTQIQDTLPKQYIEGAFTVPAAMEVIYGLYDKNIECSQWVCKPHEAKRFESKAGEGGKLHTRAGAVFPFTTQQGRKMFLLTETLSREKDDWEDCHACAPILGAAVFQEMDGAWFVEALAKDLGEFGSYGVLPPSSLVKLGNDIPGVVLDEEYMAQGIVSSNATIIGLVEGRLSVLLEIDDAGFDNQGMFGDEPGAYSYATKISFETEDPSAPFVLNTVKTGKRPTDGTDGQGPIKPFTEQHRYILKGGKYQLQ